MSHGMKIVTAKQERPARRVVCETCRMSMDPKHYPKHLNTTGHVLKKRKAELAKSGRVRGGGSAT